MNYEKILEQGGFIYKGDFYKLTSAIDSTEAEFLKKLIEKHKPMSTLEIGCAEGISSMVICETIPTKGIHLILDPNQSTEWKNMGKNNLQNVGLNNFEIVEEYSEFALPEFLKDGKRFDLVFVDGWHTFDQVLLEFFYINRLLPIGGIVVFDDSSMPGINRVMRYISNYPNYECLGSNRSGTNSKRKAFNKIKMIIKFGASMLPLKVRREIFNDLTLRSDKSIGIDGSMVAFMKKGEDQRDWGWYKTF
ncbi:MAG: class I SAM-dependent methyltransferase [Chitinophagaceae bacterium]|nr:class I SAM-dependent methyltransferase [Chitinophagaceae bacterium]